MPQYLVRRCGIWHFVRRIPQEFAALDRRAIVKISTKIDCASDPAGTSAARVRDRLNEALQTYWAQLAEGQSTDAMRRYTAARRRARHLGFDYATARELVERPMGELLSRLEALVDKRMVDDGGAVAAVLGGEEEVEFSLSSLPTTYEEISKAGIADLSPDQLRKWRNPKKRAVANFISVVGDKSIQRLVRNDALDFREWWQERILEDGLHPDTANKDFGHLSRMVKIITRHFRLKLENPFLDLRIEGGVDSQREPFDTSFVQRTILADRAFENLNAEARRVVYLVTETGLRLSEAVNLTANTIKLDHEIPHVQVRPEGRRMKAPSSQRDIPLVGAALAVMRLQPDGFPRYRDRADSLSGLVNDYMETHGMRPTQRHSFYSLRHTFKDRLREAQPAEELIDELMGHENGKPKYGAGHGLRLKKQLLERIAFKPPATL